VDSDDYDVWARVVDDSKWSYEGFLPYFRKTEHYHDPAANLKEHGLEGPIHTASVTSSGRKYPLRQQVQEAWAAVGVQEISDANSGSPQGLGELVENRRDGMRQLASTVFPLTGVQLMTETLVKHVLIEDLEGKKTATGVELANGRKITANREVILSAGAYRTPQVLLLSGIGPSSELSCHSIPQVVDAPDVGKTFHDHKAVSQWWKLRAPENGYAMGSPKFNDPAYMKGLPLDWIVTQTVPHDGLRSALTMDEGEVHDDHLLLSPPRSHTESYMVYVGVNAEDPAVPMDGTHISTSVVGLLPTSRGTISLASTDPETAPLIDPNYYATEAERYVMRTGLRKMAQVVLETPQGQELIASETVPEGHEALSPTSKDEVIDARVREFGK